MRTAKQWTKAAQLEVLKVNRHTFPGPDSRPGNLSKYNPRCVIDLSARHRSSRSSESLGTINRSIHSCKGPLVGALQTVQSGAHQTAVGITMSISEIRASNLRINPIIRAHS